MQLDIGDKISVSSIQGNNVTGNVTAILENTVILFCGLMNHVVSKKDLKKQGYKFAELVKVSKSIVVSSNRNLKD
ncbi:hypothetical protein [Carnobacterium maltaromaticum]|uniref:hypothetical protein n=1 Tax=Carnobacterium maltaromaticum TaxID=2751 RepID=UPI00295F40FF|nr:hypothetical protein [Carnobacterium maltaromaticum]